MVTGIYLTWCSALPVLLVRIPSINSIPFHFVRFLGYLIIYKVRNKSIDQVWALCVWNRIVFIIQFSLCVIR